MNKPPLKALAIYQSGLTRIAKDTSLLATHISLFTAMFVCWQLDDYVTPFRVNRRQLMAFGKIASIATYHKCIKELNDAGYIRYQPSYHPLQGSLIYWPDTLNIFS